MIGAGSGAGLFFGGAAAGSTEVAFEAVALSLSTARPPFFFGGGSCEACGVASLTTTPSVAAAAAVPLLMLMGVSDATRS